MQPSLTDMQLFPAANQTSFLPDVQEGSTSFFRVWRKECKYKFISFYRYFWRSVTVQDHFPVYIHMDISVLTLHYYI
ncbi:hypothetical protein B5F34_11945 [Mediterranea sp. An20]|nr:hypothetical protein B5F34_11945 [Mediterranea sp. An20]